MLAHFGRARRYFGGFDMQYGYEEISKLAFFGLAFGEACLTALEKQGPMAKAAAFLNCADEALELLSLDREMLKAEWGDLNGEERALLIEECREEFDIENDRLESQVEAGIEVAFKLLEGIEGAIEIWKGVS